MNNPELKKSLGFSIFVDEGASDALSTVFGLLGVLMDDVMDNTNRHAEIMAKMKTSMFRDDMNKFADFLDVFSKRVHELDWCKDPNCEEKKKIN